MFAGNSPDLHWDSVEYAWLKTTHNSALKETMVGRSFLPSCLCQLGSTPGKL